MRSSFEGARSEGAERTLSPRRHAALMTTAARMCALSLCLLAVITTAVAHAASPYPGNGSWTPGPRSYGYAGTKYVHITMNDRVQLNANVYYPTELSSGAAAPGPFPVILAITPYGIEDP